MSATAQRKPIGELEDGDSVRAFVMLTDVRRRVSEDGRSTRWTATASDATGTVAAVDWDGKITDHRDGPAAIAGSVTTYRDQLQLKITRYRVVDPAADAVHGFSMDLLIRASRFTEEELLERLTALRAYLSEPAAAAWDAVLHIHGDRFKRWPAAARNHHAFRRGLLEHTVHMGELALGIAAVYAGPGGHYGQTVITAGDFSELDVDVLLLGVLCHDLGKLEELPEVPTGEWRAHGYLHGHIPLGWRMWQTASLSAGYPSDASDHVSHLILSHHGRGRHGSPVTPATPEALILHHVDALDSQLETVREATRMDPETFARAGWPLGSVVWNLAGHQESHVREGVSDG